jgi:prephenate dehydrogenase
MTRVAWLDPNMWSELLLDNRDNLLRELDFYLNSLSEYRAALIDNDRERMRRLLADGRRCKEEVDGR